MKTKEELPDLIDLPGDLGRRGGCESFTLAIDIAAAGALDAVALQQLEHHLGRCESCRNYRERSTEISALVGVSVTGSNLSPARWREIETQLMNAVASPWTPIKHAASIVVVWFAMVFAIFLLYGYALRHVFMIAGITAAFLGVWIGWSNVVRYRRVRRELSERDFMSVHRSGLKRTVESWRTYRWILALGFVSVSVMFINAPGLLTGFAVAGQIHACVMLARTFGRARRELAVLS